MRSGEVRRFRLIPGLARAGFLIDPLPLSAADLAALANGDELARVAALRVVVRRRRLRYFSAEVRARAGERRADDGSILVRRGSSAVSSALTLLTRLFWHLSVLARVQMRNPLQQVLLPRRKTPAREVGSQLMSPQMILMGMMMLKRARAISMFD